MFIRFDPEILRRLRQRAQDTRGATASSLAQRLIDEGLRMAEHPGVVFINGPRGRQAALTSGPAVFEVVRVVLEVRAPGRDPAVAAAEIIGIPHAMVRTAINYYNAHRAEIDALIGPQVNGRQPRAKAVR